jgi:hypothetical protein
MKTGGSPLNIQQVRKVRRQRRPGYPTRPEVTRDAELLRRHVPSAWKKSAQVTAVLSIMLAAGCRNDVVTKDPTAVQVAPVFVHGEGMGSVGCVVTAPPAFLSEEEALGVISDELAKAGLSMTQRNLTLEQVLIPRLQFSGYFRRVFVSEFTENSFPLVADLVNPQKGVAVKYVAPADCDELGATPSDSTLRTYDCRDIAGKVGGALRTSRKAPGMAYGVFYDPMCRAEFPEHPRYKQQREAISTNAAADPSSPEAAAEKQKELEAWIKHREHAATETRKEIDAWEKQSAQVEATARAQSLDLLRAQVRDFIEWLKGQGAI